MGYTSVDDRSGAVQAAAQLAKRSATNLLVEDGGARLPLLAEQVMAEAGVFDAAACSTALSQASGDSARAVSLLRAWGSTMSRAGTCTVPFDSLRVVRRITPGVVDPPGGQFLGASLDYVQRLLDLDGNTGAANGSGDDVPVPGGRGRLPGRFERAAEMVEREGLVAEREAAQAVDVTRSPAQPAMSRGAFLQLLSRADTGALTAMAYAGIRGFGQRADPTLIELRGGYAPVTVTHPRTGRGVVVGEIPLTVCEVLHFGAHDTGDRRFVLGAGATTGRVERRAIAAAMLDAACAALPQSSGRERSLTEDREFLALVLDGQEATGFVEHLKLPHHVTFGSDVDVIRRAR